MQQQNKNNFMGFDTIEINLVSYIFAKNALYRMVVLEFSKLDLKTSQSEREESSDAFRRVMASPGTPIFTAMAYCHYVQTDQWDQDMK